MSIFDYYPVGTSRCFNIGMWGGCGVNCEAFIDGECEQPEEISKEEIIDEHGEEAARDIFEYYEFEPTLLDVIGYVSTKKLHVKIRIIPFISTNTYMMILNRQINNEFWMT
jgi:hypothetical protein